MFSPIKGVRAKQCPPLTIHENSVRNSGIYDDFNYGVLHTHKCSAIIIDNNHHDAHTSSSKSRKKARVPSNVGTVPPSSCCCAWSGPVFLSFFPLVSSRNAFCANCFCKKRRNTSEERVETGR